MATEKKEWKIIPLAVEPDLKAELEAAAQDLRQSQAAIMRESMRKGLPLLKHGGNVDQLVLDGEVSELANEMEKAHKRPRKSILLEAIRRGIRAVEAYLIFSSSDDVPPEVCKTMLLSDRNADPLLQEVRAIRMEHGALKIQLEDLLKHCPDARERKSLFEKALQVARRKKIQFPNLWGHGVSTEALRKHLADLEKRESPAAGDGAVVEPVPQAAFPDKKRSKSRTK